MAYATAMEVSDAQRKEHVVAVRKRAEGAPVHVEVHALFEAPGLLPGLAKARSEEHTSELQSLMRISYAVFCLKKKKSNSEHQFKGITSDRVWKQPHMTRRITSQLQ